MSIQEYSLTLEEALCTKDFENAVFDIITLSPFPYEQLEDEDKNMLLGTVVDILKHDLSDGLSYEDFSEISKNVKNHLLFSSKMAAQSLMDCYVKALQKSSEPAIREAYNDSFYSDKAQRLLDEKEHHAWEIREFHNR